MLLLALAAAMHTAIATVPGHVYEAWLKTPAGVPSNISTQTELDEFLKSPYVSAWLVGGFGNELFQIGAALAVAHVFHVNCPIAMWDQDNFNLYGTRTPPAPGITMKHIFPNIVYVSFLPHWNVNGKLMSSYPTSKEQFLTTPFVSNYPFDPTCLFRSDST